MYSRDFLLEIGHEEMPAAFQQPLTEQLRSAVEQLLSDEHLVHGGCDVFSTPRRTAVRFTAIPIRQDDREIEMKGPPKRAAFSDIGRPTPAAEGFARNAGLTVEDLEVRETPKGAYLFATKKVEGKDTIEILKERLPELIGKLNFAKSMTWESGNFRFGRPLRWIVSLFGEERIKFRVAGVASGVVTTGLRRDGSPRLTINTPDQYPGVLAEAGIIADFAERRQMVEQSVIAAAGNGKPYLSPELLDEVCNLVEYPHAVCGEFDEDYLTLPEDVIVNVMIKHQRYFPVHGPRGLLPCFIAVANGVPGNPENVIYGNQRVLGARLADAKFYYLEDQKISLFDLARRLDKVTFHEKLGSLREKVERIRLVASKLLKVLKPELTGEALEAMNKDLNAACELCKADLQSHMVFEFPELQGRMGQLYAQSEGIDEVVANAIREHYLPRQRGDEIARGLTGQLIGISDRLDTITGGFLAGLRPTGSQDPFALRRAAFGLIESTLENRLSFSLRPRLEQLLESFATSRNFEWNTETVEEIILFIRQRLETSLKERSVRYDTVDAVFSLGSDNIHDMYQRAQALETRRDDPRILRVITPAKRANNILRKEGTPEGPVDPSHFQEPVENELHQAVQNAQQSINERLAAHDYPGALDALSAIQEPVDRYFDGVLVMHEEEAVRRNRLAQLRDVAAICRCVADLSRLIIEVNES